MSPRRMRHGRRHLRLRIYDYAFHDTSDLDLDQLLGPVQAFYRPQDVVRDPLRDQRERDARLQGFSLSRKVACPRRAIGYHSVRLHEQASCANPRPFMARYGTAIEPCSRAEKFWLQILPRRTLKFAGLRLSTTEKVGSKFLSLRQQVFEQSSERKCNRGSAGREKCQMIVESSFRRRAQALMPPQRLSLQCQVVD